MSGRSPGIRNVTPGAMRRRLTQAGCRRRLMLSVAGAVGALALFVCSSLASVHALAYVVLLFQVCSTTTAIRNLRCLRRGEIVEVTENPGMRRNLSPGIAFAAAMLLTITASAFVLMLLAALIMVPNVHFKIWIALMTACFTVPLCAYTAHVWQRAMTEPTRTPIDLATTVVDCAFAGQSAVPAAMTGVHGAHGHWWTQNAVRDELIERVRR